MPRIKKSKIQQANYKMIEAEIYRYHDSLREQSERYEDIQQAQKMTDVHSTTPESPVESYVLRDLAAYQERERRLRAIDYALNIYRQDRAKLRLIEEWYWTRKLARDGVTELLHIDTKTFYRWKNGFVELIAERLGCEV